MRQVPAEKYNIAWFKLAEFVARGEKERALGIYRLLIHSFDDKAFSYQLEGDLLAAFNDESARDKYLAAAQLYHKEGRIDEAVAMYEVLVYLIPSNLPHAQQLLSLYESTKNAQALVRIAQLIQEIHITKKDLNAAEQLRERCKKMIAAHEYFALCEHAVLSLIKHEMSKEDIKKALESALVAALDKVEPNALHQFLSTLQAVDKNYWLIATQLLQK